LRYNITIIAIASLLSLFAIRRCILFNYLPAKNFFRTLGIWILYISIFSYLLYNALFMAYSFRYPIEKPAFELTKLIDKDYFWHIYDDVQINIGMTMVYTCKVAEMFLISALLIFSGIWCISGFQSGCRSPAITLWALLRIPVLLYLDAVGIVGRDKISLFIYELLMLTEFIASAFYLMIKTSRREQKIDDKVFLLKNTVLAYGVMKYGVNIVDIPFKLRPAHLYVIESVQLVLLVSLYMLLTLLYLPSVEAEDSKTKYLRNYNENIPDMSTFDDPNGNSHVEFPNVYLTLPTKKY